MEVAGSMRFRVSDWRKKSSRNVEVEVNADDRGGEECTVGWTGGSDKDIPVQVQVFFFNPRPTFL